MNRNQDIKKVEKEDRKTEKGSTKENGNYTNWRRTLYYQEQGRYNPPREWRENQGYNRGSWQRPREQRNYGMGNIRCFNCWEWGHYASSCYQTQKRYTNQNQRERGNERQKGRYPARGGERYDTPRCILCREEYRTPWCDKYGSGQQKRVRLQELERCDKCGRWKHEGKCFLLLPCYVCKQRGHIEYLCTKNEQMVLSKLGLRRSEKRPKEAQ